jgi:hypothetical protein
MQSARALPTQLQGVWDIQNFGTEIAPLTGGVRV